MDFLSGDMKVFALGTLVSWVIWVSASIFNQRTEIALLKQILHELVKHPRSEP